MNKELEKWIEENYPKQTYGTFGSCLSAEWKAGATAMAEHLEKDKYIKQLGQIPTKEQLIKAFKLFYSDKVKQDDLIDKDSDFEPIVKQILEHWYDED